MLGIPGFFIGLFGAIGILTGAKLVLGTIGALWGYLATVGAYELNRRKFNWTRGKKYADHHLLAGTLAVSVGLVISGAMHETMPVLAIVPALSAIMQANDGHEKKFLSLIHLTLLAVAIGIFIWIYADGVIGKTLLERVEALP